MLRSSPDDAVAPGNHLAFLAVDRGAVRRCAAAAADRARGAVDALPAQLSGGLS